MSSPPPGGAPAPAAPTPTPPNSQLVLEQYKVKLTDLANLGTRQTSMNTYYVSLLTALLGVLAFKDRKLEAIEPVVVLAICVPGFFVSLLWFTGVSFFRKLFRVKLDTIGQIETALPFQTFQHEYEKLKAMRQGGWLYFERYVPVVFAATFAGIALAKFLL